MSLKKSHKTIQSSKIVIEDNLKLVTTTTPINSNQVPVTVSPESFNRVSISQSPQANLNMQRYLELAKKTTDIGLFPSPTSICARIGISSQVYYQWRQEYQAFKDIDDSILHSVEDELVKYSYDNAKTPKGYMDRITLLRRIAPQRWNPNYQGVTHDQGKVIDKVSNNLSKYIDVEVIKESDDKHLET